jgi:glucose-6-phosphate dehydrogenase assembly protein OpcA
MILSEEDDLARDIFLLWVETVSAEYVSEDELGAIATNAISAARIFSETLQESKERRTNT